MHSDVKFILDHRNVRKAGQFLSLLALPPQCSHRFPITVGLTVSEYTLKA